MCGTHATSHWWLPYGRKTCLGPDYGEIGDGLMAGGFNGVAFSGPLGPGLSTPPGTPHPENVACFALTERDDTANELGGESGQ